MPLSAGSKLGPYEILAPIGAGGMGEVYRARDTRLGREVAVKLCAERFTERFEKEAHAIASLNHPNICTLHDVGPNYLVMELVEGPTLADRIGAGKLPLEETLRIARQIADALEAAHERGIVHRDLKPANIKIKSDGSVKVLDFGLAKMADSGVSDSNPENSPTLTLQDATRVGVILGTAGYMSPEQASGKPVDKRADVWAFGVVLWEMLTGHRMFSGETVSHTLAAVLIQEPDWKKLPAGTPASLRRLLRRCLQRDLKRRLSDIGTARLEIEEAVAAPPEEVAQTAPPAEIRPANLPWAIAAVATLAAVMLGFFAYQHFREETRVFQFTVQAPDKATFASSTLSNVPAISPDGRRLALAINSNGEDQLWVRDLDSLAARPIPGTEGGAAPFWSPDSRWLGFVAEGKLKKIDLAGGPALTLADSAGIFPASWGPNDVILFTPTIGGVYRVSAEGGSPTPVTRFQTGGDLFHVASSFLPDGHHFLYTVVPVNRDKVATYVGDLNSETKQLVVNRDTSTAYAAPGYLLFARERTLMAQRFDAGKAQTIGDAVPVADSVSHPFGGPAFFSVSQNGVLAYATGVAGSNTQLTWLDRSGRAAGTVGTPTVINKAAIAPDGSSVAVDRLNPQTGSSDLWLYDLARGSESRFTFGPSRNEAPVWAPDGSHVAFSALRGGLDIYQRATNGTGQDEPLDKDGRLKHPAAWSRDGRYLIEGVRDPKTKTDVWVLPLFGDRKPFPFLHSEFDEDHPRLSPNGQWLAYVSDESKRNEVYVSTFPMPGGKWQVSVNGGTMPVWSRDGKELFFLSADSRMMAVDVRGGATFERGLPKPLFDVRIAPGTLYDVGKDGRFLIPVPVEQAGSEQVQVVVNWPATLKK